MSALRNILIAGALFMSISLLVAVAVIGLLLPGWGWEKRIIMAFLAVLAPIPVLGLLRLLSALQEHEQTVQRYATRDALTDLYNQNAFWDFLNYEIERSKRQYYRFSLLLADIDNFKTINDQYGHEAGDEVLRRFAAVFKATIRKGDIPARYAGDDFAAILPICDEAQAHVVAQRLLESARQAVVTLPGGRQVRITASAGISVYPHHARDAQDLFLLADSMMGQAKSGGKDQVILPQEDTDLLQLKSAGEKSLLVLEAIRERRIVPYFQPIISVDGKSVLAYEVLTRIVTADRVVPAAEFITVAESTGAVARLNLMLMDQAFRMANEKAYTGPLFINLSPKALVISDYLAGVRSLLREHGFRPDRVVFEITERDTVKNTRMIERTVRDLRQEGFRFAIDDFGSGYSSFQYIRMFDVEYLKVDGEFIRNMDGGMGAEKAIVKSIAGLAEDLGIQTIAEYVETREILERVRSSGIKYAQGYFINRPSPHLNYVVPV